MSLNLDFGFGGVFGDFVRIWCGFHSFGLPLVYGFCSLWAFALFELYADKICQNFSVLHDEVLLLLARFFC